MNRETSEFFDAMRLNRTSDCRGYANSRMPRPSNQADLSKCQTGMSPVPSTTSKPAPVAAFERDVQMLDTTADPRVSQNVSSMHGDSGSKAIEMMIIGTGLTLP